MQLSRATTRSLPSEKQRTGAMYRCVLDVRLCPVTCAVMNQAIYCALSCLSRLGCICLTLKLYICHIEVKMLRSETHARKEMMKIRGASWLAQLLQ